MQILKEKRGYFCYLLENVIYVMQSALKATLCFIFQCSLKKKKACAGNSERNTCFFQHTQP